MSLTKSKIQEIQSEAKLILMPVWARFDEIKEYNQIKVIEAFRQAGIQNVHYNWATGYGYDDLGKDKLDELYSIYFNTEAALVRPQLVSGTHAITCAVLGNLNAGDRLVCIGEPYDTLQTVYRKLAEKYKIDFKVVEPTILVPSLRGAEGDEAISNLKTAKLISIQRSRGYEWRSSWSLDYIETLIKRIREINPNAIIFVDNCYGEFTQTREPTDIGADIIAGSLIKNPGGGIVAAGAYIAGRKTLIDNAAEALTAPGIGAHGGCMFDQTRLYFQGFYLAPLMVSEALKGMSYAAKVFSEIGLETIPAYDAERDDVIQAIKFNDREKLIKFCQLVQKYSPVNSMFSPIPSEISGYDDEIIMASGSFIEGSSIELSVDAPLREPYIGYFQGGLSYAHTQYVVNKIIESL